MDSVKQLLESEELDEDKKIEIRRYLEPIADTLYEIKEEKEPNIYGSLKFDSKTLKSRNECLTGAGPDLALRGIESLEYFRENNKGYRIELECIEKLKEDAEDIEKHRTREEEKQLIRKTVEQLSNNGDSNRKIDYPTYREVKETFDEDIEHSLTEDAFRKRFHEQDNIEKIERAGNPAYKVAE